MAITTVRETMGICVECGNEAILGDGRCRECWDRQADQLEDFVKHYNKEDRDRYESGRNKEILDMANARIKYYLIAAKFGLKANTVEKIVRQMRALER
jgi:hypothetical protein